MRNSSILAILMLGAGVALLIWGIAASDSLSSETSELVQGAPSNKAIVLMIVGVVVGGFGLVKMLRRPAS